MITATVLKRLSLAAASATFVLLGAAFTNASAAKAAILSVDDSGSWVTGTNTLSNLGFDMVNVTDSSQPDFSSVSTLSSSLGDLTFSPSVQKRTVGSSWATWSHGYQGTVYTSDLSLAEQTETIFLPSAIGAFDLYVEPNIFGTFSIAVTALDGVTKTLVQNIEGYAGAKYFGFYSTDGDTIKSIKITSPSEASGFAVGELRLATAKSVPEPASTLGVLALGAFGASLMLKRKQQQKATVKVKY